MFYAEGGGIEDGVDAHEAGELDVADFGVLGGVHWDPVFLDEFTLHTQP